MVILYYTIVIRQCGPQHQQSFSLCGTTSTTFSTPCKTVSMIVCHVKTIRLRLLTTHAVSSRLSIAIIRVCDSVCVSVRTIKPKRLKLK